MKKNTTQPAKMSEADLRAACEPFEVELAHRRDLERRAAAEALLGRCYRYRNCYSCPTKDSDYWWLYARVIGASEQGSPIAFQFQIDQDGKIEVEPTARFMASTGFMEIPRSDFDAAWRVTQAKIANLNATVVLTAKPKRTPSGKRRSGGRPDGR